MTKQTYSVYELIDEISPRLEMFIGDRTVDKLCCFIWGYRRAMFDLGIPESPDLNINAFTRWVRKKYGYDGSAEIAGCEKTILAISLGIAPEELRWDIFPPAVTPEQQFESAQLFISLLREFGRVEGHI